MKRYDYIFCGMWASTSLLLWELDRQELLKNKKILVIEREKKDKNDKTFCFWSQDKEPITKYLKDIISQSWDSTSIKQEKKLVLSPYTYHKIHSIDLYEKSFQIIRKYKIELFMCEIWEIWEDTGWIYVRINGESTYANTIFDWRTPTLEIQNKKSHIYQSFVWWTVEIKSPLFDHSAFTFMDFNIEQDGATQFIYILPISASKALVEVTRFGIEILKQIDAEKILETYILSHFWIYKKCDTEIWCIPMSHSKVVRSEIPWLIHMWARNYNIKASTGYAFKNMYYHAFQIATAIKNRESIQHYNKSYTNMFSNRFWWYDWLFLDVLKYFPKDGKNILWTMTQKIPIQKVFLFLDQKTTIKEEISLFYKLPWSPFLKILYKRMISSSYFHPFILIFAVFFLIFLWYYTPFQKEFGYFFLFLWLIFVGIPHGAVDHLLETQNWHIKKAPMFIIQYLGLASIIGLLWYIFPQIALIIFLLYSMWHFWEADGKTWDFSRLLSFIWGMSVLLYILGTHFEETNQILVTLWSIPLPFEIPILALIPWLLLGCFKKKPSFILTIIWLTLTSFIPLILAFGIYFIGQHSMTGWWHLKQYLHKTNKNIWLESLPFHLWAWIILLWFYFFWPLQESDTDFWKWAVFFIFIACISFPHVITMHLMYKKLKKS